MKVNETPYAIESYGMGKAQPFKIEASNIAFKILSSQLYSNKIQAVIRELGTNAADAHIAANNLVPFEVNLPNYLDQEFYIRDFGVGLSEEDMRKLYTTYFASDKRDSDAFTGCLGLGSKSPFSYVENFTVESFFNGTKCTYLCFINENGFPAINKINEEKTDEHNGLKIAFAVKSGDTGTFVQEAKNVYSYFNIKPKIVSHTDFEFIELNTQLEYDNWRFVKAANIYSLAASVVMGNVRYPTNLIVQYQNLVPGCDIIINCNIGDVDITASREQLEYTEKTNSYLREQLVKVKREIAIAVERDIQSQPDFFNACCYLHEHDWISGVIKYNGKTVIRSVHNKAIDVTLPDGTKDTSYIYRFRAIEKTRKYRSRSVRSEYVDKTPYLNKKVFIYDDLPKGGITRIRYFCGEHLYSGKESSYHVIEGNLQEFLDDSEFPDNLIIRSSSLDKAPVSPRNAANTKIKLYKYEPSYSGAQIRDACKDVTIDGNTEGVYLKIHNYSPEGVRIARSGNMYSYKEIIEHCGYKDLYLIPATNKRKMNKTKLKHIDIVLTEVKKKYEDKQDLIMNMSGYNRFSSLTHIKNYTANEKLKEEIEKIEDIKKNAKLYSSLQCIFGTNRYDEFEIKELDNYTMLRPLVLGGTLGTVNDKELEEYFKTREKECLK